MALNLDILRRIPIAPYVEQARSYYDGLNERERYIIGGSAIALGLITVVLVFSTMASSLNRLETRIASDGEVARKIDTLKSTYIKSKEDAGNLEAIVKRTPADFSLATHLESVAKGFGIAPDSMNPKPVPPNELYNENQVEVRINKVTLKALIDYLYRIENSEELIRVNSLSIKPNFTDPAYLSAVFTVSAFTAKG